MSGSGVRRALISVYDKTGVVEFARALHEEFGIEILSTGGTAAVLRQNGIPVTPVEDVTGSGEMLDGRVKTLHPRIHAAILADRGNSDHMRQLAEAGISPIDMVVVNLYPFEEAIRRSDCTFDEAIEMIDIGGPCLLRAAAKNHRHVLVCSDPAAYPRVLASLRDWDDEKVQAETCRAGAFEAFWSTTGYDSAIATWLRADVKALHLQDRQTLRYGENPHQRAELLRPTGPAGDGGLADPGVAESETPLSYNNYLDADAALELCRDLADLGKDYTWMWRSDTDFQEGGIVGPEWHRPEAGATQAAATLTGVTGAACCFIKHGNPCGVGIAADPVEAYRRAYLGDPNAAMGGVLACNCPVTPVLAEAVMDSLDRWGKGAGAGAFFVEVWVAPRFDERAVEIIRSARSWGPRVRLLRCGMDGAPDADRMTVRTIAGGVLMQTPDRVGLNESEWQVVTRRTPTSQEMSDLRLAWLIAKHTKSNAISLVHNGQLIGNGAGQMSRVMSCRIVTWLAKENGHAAALAAAVAASDGFFPFRDGPDLLAEAGVSAVIQPGGSKRDADVIAACDERGLAMVITGTRHFRH